MFGGNTSPNVPILQNFVVTKQFCNKTSCRVKYILSPQTLKARYKPGCTVNVGPGLKLSVHALCRAGRGPNS